MCAVDAHPRSPGRAAHVDRLDQLRARAVAVRNVRRVVTAPHDQVRGRAERERTNARQAERSCGMPRHTNTVEHEQYVLRGQAMITIGDETHHVKTGDVVFIPEGMIHSYQNTDEEPFEFLCIIPNKEDKVTVVDASC